MEASAIIERIDRAADVPTLPTLLVHVDQLMQKPDVTIGQIERVVEKDQAMAAKLLRLANSAFYGCVAPVADLHSAMILMGFNTVRSAVLSISVVRAFAGVKEMEGFRIEEFWQHAAAVAITSRFLAQQSGMADPEQAFVGGLIHDIGKILLVQLFPGLMAAVWSCMRQHGVGFSEAESRALPVNHTVLGSRLALRWRLPDGLIEAIRLHHCFPVRSHPPLAAVVASADRLVNACTLPTQGLAPHLEPDEFPVPLQSLILELGAWYPGLKGAVSDGAGYFSGID